MRSSRRRQQQHQQQRPPPEWQDPQNQINLHALVRTAQDIDASTDDGAAVAAGRTRRLRLVRRGGNNDHDDQDLDHAERMGLSLTGPRINTNTTNTDRTRRVRSPTTGSSSRQQHAVDRNVLVAGLVGLDPQVRLSPPPTEMHHDIGGRAPEGWRPQWGTWPVLRSLFGGIDDSLAATGSSLSSLGPCSPKKSPTTTHNGQHGDNDYQDGVDECFDADHYVDDDADYDYNRDYDKQHERGRMTSSTLYSTPTRTMTSSSSSWDGQDINLDDDIDDKTNRNKAHDEDGHHGLHRIYYYRDGNRSNPSAFPLRNADRSVATAVDDEDQETGNPNTMNNPTMGLFPSSSSSSPSPTRIRDSIYRQWIGRGASGCSRIAPIGCFMGVAMVFFFLGRWTAPRNDHSSIINKNSPNPPSASNFNSTNTTIIDMEMERNSTDQTPLETNHDVPLGFPDTMLSMAPSIPSQDRTESPSINTGMDPPVMPTVPVHGTQQHYPWIPDYPIDAVNPTVNGEKDHDDYSWMMRPHYPFRKDNINNNNNNAIPMNDTLLDDDEDYYYYYRRVCQSVGSDSILCLTIRFPFPVPIVDDIAPREFLELIQPDSTVDPTTNNTRSDALYDGIVTNVDERFYTVLNDTHQLAFFMDGEQLRYCQENILPSSTFAVNDQRVKICLDWAANATTDSNPVVAIWTRGRTKLRQSNSTPSPENSTEANNFTTLEFELFGIRDEEKLNTATYDYLANHTVLWIGGDSTVQDTALCAMDVFYPIECGKLTSLTASLLHTDVHFARVCSNPGKGKIISAVLTYLPQGVESSPSLPTKSLATTLIESELFPALAETVQYDPNGNSTVNNTNTVDALLHPLSLIIQYPLGHTTSHEFLLNRWDDAVQFQRDFMKELLRIQSDDSRQQLREVGYDLQHIIVLDGIPQFYPTSTGSYTTLLDIMSGEEDFWSHGAYRGWDPRYGSRCLGPHTSRSAQATLNRIIREAISEEGLSLPVLYGPTWVFANEFWWQTRAWLFHHGLDCSRSSPVSGLSCVTKYVIKALVEDIMMRQQPQV